MLKGVPFLIGFFVLCLVVVLVPVLMVPRIGQEVVLVKDTELVIDWNAYTQYKPHCPAAPAGTIYEIDEISTLNRLGSQGSETIYWLKPVDGVSCAGWAFEYEFKKNKEVSDK
jgi:hypothetical protein